MNQNEKNLAKNKRKSTGIKNLDKILDGGLIKNRSYLVRGPPGAGKTLLGLHYLTQGNKNQEKSLFINFGEPEEHIKKDAKSFGFNIEPIKFLDLSPSENFFKQNQEYTVFQSEEVETPKITEKITDKVEKINPDRVFIDPMTQLRYLTSDQFQFHKQVLSFMKFLKNQDTTIIYTSQKTQKNTDEDLQFMSDGIIHIEYDTPRTIEITKFRGSNFQSGKHTLKITKKGMSVYPRIIPRKHQKEFTGEQVSSGIPEIDEILHGGLERGTNTIFSGPTGTGKTTLGIQFMKEAAGRGERSVIYSFEESTDTILHRSESLNIPVKDMIEHGNLQIEEIDPQQYSVNEFTNMVRNEVEEENSKIVMVDGIQGYKKSLLGISGEEGLQEIVSFSRYLKNMGVTSIFINPVHEITGDFKVTGKGISYLADNILFLRHVEYKGELRKIIGVLKKRASNYERKLREIELTSNGIKVGKPLSDLRGILTGTPTWTEK